MLAELARKWVALVLGAVVLSTGCITVTPPAGRGMLLDRNPRASPGLAGEVRGDAQYAATGSNAPTRLLRRRGERVQGTEVAMVSPAEMAVRAVASGAVQVDAFEHLLALAGLDNFNDLPPRGAPLSPQEAARVLTVLMNKPVTLGSFPPRMAACYLLREVLEGGDVSREELLRRVERFKTVAVLRPDGYLAWTLNGRTQQKVGPVEWKEEAFRAGSFELGRFYTVSGWVFRQEDAQLRPLMEGPPLAEVYDDADYIGRSLDGAEEAFVELYHAMGHLLTRPLDSIAALQHLPAGIAALIASSPEYLERFRYMTRGEQVKATSKLLTNLIVTFGTAGGTTSTLTRALGGLEATVPVLSLSADGLLAVRSVAVPVGKAATVLSGGPGAAIILHQMGGSGDGGSTADYVHMGSVGNGIVATIDKSGVVEMAVAAPKGSAIRGTELFRGMMEHFGKNVRAIRGNWRYGDNLAEVNKLVGENVPLEIAVTKTWTARRAAEYGFTRAIVVEVKGAPGAYSFIQVLFTK
ncbi:hypothetical protein JQX13_45250 [Archangium violaceum]|uniref:hypothetical protein n=1 Tax=Archangium violaceum TaxID=83451 RepID=UPI00193B3518|nr:hypothetical protein [Archangium violaceum]QRK07182.1 hypothetical protein JQX13_45250 [Archangium violaceum]